MYVWLAQPASRGHLGQISSTPGFVQHRSCTSSYFYLQEAENPRLANLYLLCWESARHLFHSQGHCCCNSTQRQCLALSVRSCGCPYAQLLDGWTLNHLSCSEVFLSAGFNSLPCFDLFLQCKLSGLTACFQMSLQLHFPQVLSLTFAHVKWPEHGSSIPCLRIIPGSVSVIHDFLQACCYLCCHTNMAPAFSSSPWYSC